VESEVLSEQDELRRQAYQCIQEMAYTLYRDQVSLTEDQKKALYTNIWELYS
jgi:hypothetical protein